MIFHSVRDAQYASHKFRNYVASYNIRQSMSRKENCWDNTVAESFFRSLKTEMMSVEFKGTWRMTQGGNTFFCFSMILLYIKFKNN